MCILVLTVTIFVMVPARFEGALEGPLLDCGIFKLLIDDVFFTGMDPTLWFPLVFNFTFCSVWSGTYFGVRLNVAVSV